MVKPPTDGKLEPLKAPWLLGTAWHCLALLGIALVVPVLLQTCFGSSVSFSDSHGNCHKDHVWQNGCPPGRVVFFVS